MGKTAVVLTFAVLAGAFNARGGAASGEKLAVTFRTTDTGGPHKPLHCVAVWIEDARGNLVRTLARWGSRRQQYLVGWAAKVGDVNSVDGVTAATVSNHKNDLTAEWDMKDKAGNAVLDGVYVLRIELADRNARTVTYNHQGQFPFRKDGKPSTQRYSAKGFPRVTIGYSGRAAAPAPKPEVRPAPAPAPAPRPAVEAPPKPEPKPRPKRAPMTDDRRRRSKMGLARSFESNKMVDKAAEIYREVVAKWPDSEEAATARARLKFFEKKKKEAEEAAEEQ